MKGLVILLLLPLLLGDSTPELVSDFPETGYGCSSDSDCWDYEDSPYNCCIDGICYSRYPCCHGHHTCISNCCIDNQCEATSDCGGCSVNSQCQLTKCCRNNSCILGNEICCSRTSDCSSNCCINQQCERSRECGGCTKNSNCIKSNCCKDNECMQWDECYGAIFIIVFLGSVLVFIGLIGTICWYRKKSKENW